MLPTSLTIQIDAGTSAGVSTARLHGIGSDFVMAVWETASAKHHAGHHGRVVPSIDGAEAPRPYTLLTVPTSWGGERTLAFLRCPAGAGAITFHDEHDHAVASAPGSVSRRFRRRLADERSGWCGTAADRPPAAGFLPQRLQPSERSPVRRPVPPPDPGAFTNAVRPLRPLRADAASGAVRRQRSRRLRRGDRHRRPDQLRDAPPGCFPGGRSVADKRGRQHLHLVIDRALCGSETLVVLLGRTGLACRTVTGAGAELPSLLEWLERRKPCPPALRDHVMRALAVRAADEPQAAARPVRELQVLMPLPRRHVALPRPSCRRRRRRGRLDRRRRAVRSRLAPRSPQHGRRTARHLPIRGRTHHHRVSPPFPARGRGGNLQNHQPPLDSRHSFPAAPILPPSCNTVASCCCAPAAGSTSFHRRAR